MSGGAALEPALREALRAAGLPTCTGARDLSGGCIHVVRALHLEDGATVIAKVAGASALALLEEESAGLEALAATGTVIVPRPLGVGVHGSRAVLLMTAIERARPSRAGWAALGAALAALHARDAGPRYGFPTDNHLGTTPQPNGWRDDWVAFNAEHRLGWQLGLARRHGRLPAPEARRVETIVERLDRFLPRRPRPSLLHGDLWSGNALPTVDASGTPAVAVIDPACSIGDGWADIAMMRLFGGFPDPCLDAYRERVSDHEAVPLRIDVYQLYHLLNHVNLFGAGYVGRAMEVVERLERA